MPPDTRLVFDEEKHLYFYDGHIIPSVTEICSPLQSFDDVSPAVLQQAQRRGTQVHEYTQLIDYGVTAEELEVEPREVFPGRIERKIVWDISQLPPIGKCLRYGPIAPKGNYCLTCGWNETEYRRRLQCPWVQKDGLWHLDISLPKEKTT